MTGERSGIKNATFALNKLLRAGVTSVQNRVFPPGIRKDSQMPRIIINALTPNERDAGLGAGIPNWNSFTFRIDIFDLQPQRVDDIADEVKYTVDTNRYYAPGTVTWADWLGRSQTVSANGYFILLRLAGGTPTDFIPTQGKYHRVMNVVGRWYQSA